MLADQDGDPFVPMMIEQRQHVAMPQRKNDRASFPAQRVDARFVIDQLDAPAGAKRSHERHPEAYDPFHPSLASPLRARQGARRPLGRRRGAKTAHPVAPMPAPATSPAPPPASSIAIDATRRAAPGVPNESRTRASPVTMRARFVLS